MVPYTDSPLSGNSENAAQTNLSYRRVLHLYRLSNLNNRGHQLEVYGIKSSNSHIIWTDALILEHFCEIISIKYHKVETIRNVIVNWLSVYPNTDSKKWPAHSVIHKYRAPRRNPTTAVSQFPTLKEEDINLSLSTGQ